MNARKSFALCTYSALVVGSTILQAQSSTSPTPREQLQQYVTQLQANPSDDALRTKIIALALTLDPKPANPPDLPETIGAATYAFKSARSDTDMMNAADLYTKASLEAPWQADLYYDEGLALEKAKRLDEAVKAFQFYLLAAPNADDADDVKEKIGALKYQVSQQQQQEQQQAAQAHQRVMDDSKQRSFEGTWLEVVEGDGNLMVSKDYGGVYHVDRVDNLSACHTPLQIESNGRNLVIKCVYPSGAASGFDLSLSEDGQALTGTRFMVYETGQRPTWPVKFLRQ